MSNPTKKVLPHPYNQGETVRDIYTKECFIVNRSYWQNYAGGNTADYTVIFEAKKGYNCDKPSWNKSTNLEPITVPNCATCGKPCLPAKISTGYGTDEKGAKHCYECCGARDEADLKERGKGVLYLHQENGKSWLTNWPNTLNIQIGLISKGSHNFAGSRYDVWFKYDGSQWHGVQYGDNTQICHVRRTKG